MVDLFQVLLRGGVMTCLPFLKGEVATFSEFFFFSHVNTKTLVDWIGMDLFILFGEVFLLSFLFFEFEVEIKILGQI